MAVDKHRNWWFILYPESSPPNWKEIITERGLPFCISPLHEYDLKNEEGELKKPHHHIILCYSGPTTYSNVKRLTVDELGQTIPKPIDHIGGAHDYLTHKNHPDKFQYSEDEIEYVNGFDIKELIALSEKDKAATKIAILHDIQQYQLKEYSKLLNFYMEREEYEKFNVAASSTIMLNAYITSLRHSQSDDNK